MLRHLGTAGGPWVVCYRCVSRHALVSPFFVSFKLLVAVCLQASMWPCEPRWCKPLIGCWSFQAIRGFFSSCWQLPWYASSKGAAFVQAWSQFFVAWLCSKAVKVNVESRSTKDISSGWKFASCSPMALGSLCTGQKVHLAGVPVRILFSWSKWCRTWENPYSRSFVLIFLLQILRFNFLFVRTLRGLQISRWQIRTCDNFSMPVWFLKAWTWCQWRRSWRWTTTLDVSVIVANS